MYKLEGRHYYIIKTREVFLYSNIINVLVGREGMIIRQRKEKSSPSSTTEVYHS